MADKKVEYKEIVHKLIDGLWKNRELKVIDEIIAPDAHITVEFKTYRGITGFKQMVHNFLQAIPDLRYELKETIIENDTVIIRWEGEGTLKQDFGSYKATGKHFTYWGLAMLKMRHNKIAEIWSCSDLPEALRVVS